MCGGVGSNTVGVHNSAFLKLSSKEYCKMRIRVVEKTPFIQNFLEGDELSYLFDVATSVKGVTEDHLVIGNLRSAVRIIQVQAVAIIAQRVQV